jgi:oligopeptide/dipeptide ABC transporter ATP-binding protein
MVQDSMSSLDPVWRVGSQLMETLALKSPRPAAALWRSRLIKGRAPKAAIRELALEALAEAGLEDPEERFDAFPHQLSGGQRQRVAMALALAGDPDLLVADEPTTALDVVTQRRLMNRLVASVRQRGAALVLISHDLALVGELADDLVVLYAGRVMETGPAAEILSSPAHPYTRALLSARAFGTMGGVFRLARDEPEIPGEDSEGCPFQGRCREAARGCAVLPELEAVGELRFSRCRPSRTGPRPAVSAAQAA